MGSTWGGKLGLQRGADRALHRQLLQSMGVGVGESGAFLKTLTDKEEMV